jgi:hypothetical protein
MAIMKFTGVWWYKRGGYWELAGSLRAAIEGAKRARSV